MSTSHRSNPSRFPCPAALGALMAPGVYAFPTLPADVDLPSAGLVAVLLVLLALVVAWNIALRRRLALQAKTIELGERRFRDTFEHASSGIAQIGSDGRFLRVNRRYAQLLGYRPEELVGLMWQTLTHPDDLTDAERQSAQLRNNEMRSFSSEKRYVRKDGSVIWAQLTVSTVHDPESDTVTYLSVMDDITERRNAERTIEQQREFLDLVIENLPVGVFAKDVRDDYRFAIFNARMEELLSIPRTDLIGKTDYDLMEDREEADYYRSTDEAVMRNGKILDIALEHVTGRDRVVPAHTVKVPVYDEKGEPHLLLGILEDLTDRQEAERALRESESRYRSLYEHMSEVVALYEILHNDRGEAVDYLILDANPAFETALGTSLEEAIGKPAGTVFGEKPPRYIDIYSRVARTGKPETFETYIDRLDKHFRISVFCPAPGRCAIVALDITALKRAEEERRKLDAQVQHAQKLESLGVLAGGIAHDFNNLLVGILGNADLALSSISPVSPVRDNLADIEQAARRAAELCRQMLAYSGKGRFVVEHLDLSEIVREMGHMLEVAISKNVVLRYEFAPNVPCIEADATQIRQIVMNLITNASEAIGERSGVVSINTGAMECSRAYLSETYLDDDLPEGVYAYVEVSDTGCGMDKQTQEKVFEPFFTTKFTGRGLGLAAVLGIVRGHRGAVKIYSEVGKGTTFKVLFPATELSAGQERTPARLLSDWRPSGTVLLVDDEETVRAVGRRMLEQVGFRVLTATDGREGLEMFRQNADDIVCVLLDLTMPHMDGEQAFREMRRINPDVAVVLSSGYNEQEVINRFAGKGLAGFIQKPYQTDALIQKMHQVLSGGSTDSAPSAQ